MTTTKQGAQLKATLEFGDEKAVFEGSYDDVWRSISRFLAEISPSTAQLANVLIKIDAATLLEKTSKIIKIDKDMGPVPSPGISLSGMTGREKLLFWLLAQRVAAVSGFASRDALEVDRLEKVSSVKNTGVVLSQVASDKLVQNIAEPGKKGFYRITDYGTETFLQKIKQKILPKKTDS